MERLQKVMAHAGVASRRKSEALILDGRVKVNGETITTLGYKVSAHDIISVDDVPIVKERLVYILYNKPRYEISTVNDPHGRDTVVDNIEKWVKERIYPVGRLDWDTTGALLLTNDGELTHVLTHPSFEFSKTYVAKVSGKLLEKESNQLRRGIMLDGVKTAPAQVEIIERNAKKNQTTVRITLHEGRNHQVKNMFEHIGHPVETLTREKFGPLDVHDLPNGQWRYLKPFEIQQLKQFERIEKSDTL
ncbi:pseudouridine synthase [Allofustis seminis]|uniref:pseudouridine synthase n=1 Tax=Allofustis seminis TaxID=166939 RepID=UPI0003626A6A|nr:pseudouridine synthase [Allofustis seminis]